MAEADAPVPPAASSTAAPADDACPRRAWPSRPWGVGALAALMLLALWGLAWSGARLVKHDSSFSISARTEVLTLEVACGEQLVWDLPPGEVLGASSEAEPQPAQRLSVSLRDGARARLRLDADKRWLLTLDRAPGMGCTAATPDRIGVQVDERSLPPDPEGVHYRSRQAYDLGERPAWPLRGRVVIGEEISFGAGLGGGSSTPMLVQARLEVRTPDAATGQRRLIHEEQVDAGGIVDSHGCLDVRADDLPACVSIAGSVAEGFVHVADGEGSPGFDVQLLVTGERVGVRQQAGSERRVVVSWWAHVLSDSAVQMFAAGVAALSVLLGLLAALKELLPAPAGGREERSR
ncbi:MAG TPA: hypothetical protein PKO45_11725 [Rubrivivax sp.]|nr:hypothetical protein [Burkholderiales bacterium]HNT39773.1 hypothetical protein [Rubrivivax sp.]